MTTIQYGNTSFPNNQVNGDTQPGSFLSGQFDFFTISTTVPCFNTNVKAPLSAVLASLNVGTLSSSKSYTVVDGTGTAQTYQMDADYTDALACQSNLDALVAVFSTRANPVMISVSASGTVAASGTTYTINIATEHNSLWLADLTKTDSNTVGYNFLGANGIAGVPAMDTAGVTVYNSAFTPVANNGASLDGTHNIKITQRSAL
jgi:hypothetical protein